MGKGQRRSNRCPARRPRNSALNASGRGSRARRHHQPRRRVASVCHISTSSTAAAATASAAVATATTRGQVSSSSSSSSSSDEGSDEEISSSSSSSSSVKASDSKQKKKEVEDSADAMQTRLDWKLALLYTLLVLQVLVVMVYVTSTPHVSDLNAPASPRDTVSFVNQAPQALYSNKSSTNPRTISGETSLKDIKTFRLFQAYNRTLCWRGGINERRMDRELASGEFAERCICEPGWHGSDCGQPEVVWRAIMASKQNVQLKRRKVARRIVHTFYVHDHNSAIAEVIVEELYHVVDLFVVCDFSLAEDNFKHKLAKGFLGKQQDKILYVNVASKAKKPARVISKFVWDRVKKVVRNIRDDDIYVSTSAEQILNSRALMFLKLYDGWPQPIGFRLRWSVFGFFWQHPSRTTITIGACTVGLMREAYRFNSLVLEKELTNEVAERESLGLVIGDLNHYGGWYCQYCQGPANIIVALREQNKTKEMVIERNVDVPFIEDLIGNGLWFDEKTNLLRAYKSRESYYAPEAVMNMTWKYDWLVDNFYAKLDYY